jgi:hypothetical protein
MSDMYSRAEGFMRFVVGGQQSNNLNDYVQMFEEWLILLTIFFPYFFLFILNSIS